MGNINFYNWREEENQKVNQKNQAFLFGCLMLAIAICALLFLNKNKELERSIAAKKYIEKQEEIMTNTESEIKSMNEAKDLIIEKINIIKDLQKERPVLVYSLDEITTAIPDNVYLEKMNRTNNIVSMKGVALTNDDVGSFIKNIKLSKTLKEPRIMDIKKLQKEGYLDSVQFNIVAQIDVTNENVIGEEE